LGNIWQQRAEERLLPLSREQDNFWLAIKEWFWTKEVFDLKDVHPDDWDYDNEPLEIIQGVEYQSGKAFCGLCGKEDLRYVFRIQNRLTDNFLFVGSKCIEKFDIISKNGSGGTERNSEMHREKSRVIKEQKHQHVIKCLLQIMDETNEIKVQGFIDYFNQNKAFTPKQLFFLIRRLRIKNINYQASAFKIKLRRDREKDQILNSSDDNVKEYLWESMSAGQREWYVQRMQIRRNRKKDQILESSDDNVKEYLWESMSADQRERYVQRVQIQRVARVLREQLYS